MTKLPIPNLRGWKLPAAVVASGALLGIAFSQGWGPDVMPMDVGDRWEIDDDFPQDSITFVRLMHNGRKWETDFPDAEINFTARLQQLTSIQVNPEPIQLHIDDPELFNYPIAFMSNMEDIYFTPKEEEAVRSYLSNGGFILVDDLWGDDMWEDIRRAMKGVFPDIDPTEITDLNHPIFSGIFKLDFIPQVPSHDAAEAFIEMGEEDKHYEITMLRKGMTEDELDTPHFQAWLDERGRIMMLVCHNNDLADGWEEEDYKPWFFEKYAEKVCFPMGINIVFYALTH